MPRRVFCGNPWDIPCCPILYSRSPCRSTTSTMPSPRSKSGRRLLPPALLLDKCAITVRLMVRQACPEPRSIAACLGHRRFRLAVYPPRFGRTNRSAWFRANGSQSEGLGCHLTGREPKLLLLDNLNCLAMLQNFTSLPQTCCDTN